MILNFPRKLPRRASSIFVYFVVVLNVDEKTDLKHILFLNSPKYQKSILTFQSLAHHCRPLPTRIVASAAVVAFVDCTSIIIELLLLVVDL